VYHVEADEAFKDWTTVRHYMYGKDRRPICRGDYHTCPLWFCEGDMLYSMIPEVILYTQCAGRIEKLPCFKPSESTSIPYSGVIEKVATECSFFSRRLQKDGTSRYDSSCDWGGTSIFFDGQHWPQQFVIDIKRKHLWLTFRGKRRTNTM